MAAQIEWREGLQKTRIDAKTRRFACEAFKPLSVDNTAQQRLIGQVTQFLDPSLNRHLFPCCPFERQRCEEQDQTRNKFTSSSLSAWHDRERVVDASVIRAGHSPTSRKQALHRSNSQRHHTCPSSGPVARALSCPKKYKIRRPQLAHEEPPFRGHQWHATSHPQNQASRDPVARPCPKNVCATCP